MSDKERENIGCGFLLGVSPALIVMAAGLACLADKPGSEASERAITDKAAPKIESVSVQKPADSPNVQIAMRDSLMQKQK